MLELRHYRLVYYQFLAVGCDLEDFTLDYDLFISCSP